MISAYYEKAPQKFVKTFHNPQKQNDPDLRLTLNPNHQEKRAKSRTLKSRAGKRQREKNPDIIIKGPKRASRLDSHISQNTNIE